MSDLVWEKVRRRGVEQWVANGELWQFDIIVVDGKTTLQLIVPNSDCASVAEAKEFANGIHQRMLAVRGQS